MSTYLSIHHQCLCGGIWLVIWYSIWTFFKFCKDVTVCVAVFFVTVREDCVKAVVGTDVFSYKQYAFIATENVLLLWIAKWF